VAKSFAGIYVAGIGSAGELDRDPVCAELQRALPGIEALTLELPPLGGPGGDEGAARLRQK
jgi:hypothetical protein